MGLLYSFPYPRGTPQLKDAAAALGLPEDALDPQFGVICTDPAQRIYAVQTRSDFTGRATRATPQSNPRIEPFGPPG